MSGEKKSLSDLCSFFFAKYKNILAIIAVIVITLILANYDTDEDKFKFNSNLNIYIIIILSVAVLVFGSLKIIRRKVIFQDENIVLETKMLFVKTYKYFEYDRISNFIIGRIVSNKIISRNNYSVYIVEDDNNIIKLISLKSYKDCLEIIQNIKSRTNIKVYDDTDTYYTLEEDLFRNFYKIKNMIAEIKNE